jgi:type IV pilus assembly protein PilO
MKLLVEVLKLRKKTFIALAVLAVINAVLFVYVLGFQEPRISALQTTVSESARRTRGGPDNKYEIFTRGTRDLGLFRTRIPPKREFVRVVGEIFEAAGNNGLPVRNVGYKPEVLKEGGLLLYSLNFSVTGTYAATKSFIADIQQLPEMVFIDNMSLNNGTDQQGSVTLKTVISAFFRTDGQ